MRNRHWVMLVCLLLSMWVLPLTASAENGVTVDITMPGNMEVNYGKVQVYAWIKSNNNLKSVTASIDDRFVLLKKVKSSCVEKNGCSWTGEIQLSGLSFGNKQAVVKAVDLQDRVVEDVMTFIHDEPPAIQITKPEAYTLSPMKMHIKAQATDASGPPSLTIFAGSDKIFDGTGSVDRIFDMSDYAGREVNLRFRAVDAAGYPSEKKVSLYIEAQPNSERWLIDQVPGTVMDFTQTKTLYLTKDKKLKLKNRVTGAEERSIQINPKDNFYPATALTDNEALVFSNSSGPPDYLKDLYLWKNGTVTQLTYTKVEDGYLPLILKSDRNQVVYNDSRRVVYILNTETGARSEGLENINRAYAAPDGTFILAGQEVYSYRDGEQPVLLSEKKPGREYAAPLTDGTSFLYTAEDRMNSSTKKTLILHKNGQEVELSSTVNEEMPEYMLNNGWIAYQKPVNGFKQLFLISPQGEERQLTHFNTPSELIYLEPDGAVYYYNDQVHLLKPGDAKSTIVNRPPDHSWNGLIRKEDRLYRMYSNKLYEIRREFSDDTINPVWPSASSLAVTEVKHDSVQLQWQPAWDDRRVTAYDIALNGVLLYSVSGNVYTYTVDNLSPDTYYHFNVVARDEAWNVTASSASASATTDPSPPADVTSPEWPAGEILSVSEVTYGSVLLSWQQAADAVGVSGYRLFQDQQLIADVTGTTYEVRGLQPSTPYLFHAVAYDAAGNFSEPSRSLSVTTAVYTPVPEAAQLSLTAKPGFYDVGSTVEVTLRAKNAQDLYAFLLKTGYNSAQLRLTQVQLSREFGLESQTAVIGKNMNTAGLASFSGSLLGSTPGRSGDMGTIVLKFTILAKGSADIELLPGTSLADSSGRVTALSTPVKLTLNVSGADLDGDGVVSLSDLLLVSRHSGTAAGQPGFDSRYDLNYDSLVDAQDVQYVANKLAKASV